MPTPGTDAGEALRAQLKGDLHCHSDWSDGGDTIRDMAIKARDLGHEYFALTDHSPRLTVANGLSVHCRVADRGPFVGGRIVDLDKEVFDNLAPPASGIIDVKIAW